MFNYFIFVAFYSTGIAAKIYFKEEFTDDDWQKRWTASQHPRKDWGKFVLTPGLYYGDPEISKGIQTSEDGKFYALTTKFEPFSNKDKVLVIQYSVKYEQDIKCGGAYVKLFDCSFNPKTFHSYKPYLIQFGPDICGFKKIHVIFNYEERKLAMKRELSCKDDRLTHLYTLVIKPDNSYLIKIDNKIERTGMLLEDWDFVPRRMINDTKVTKPLGNPKSTDLKDAKSHDWNQTDVEFYFNGEEQKNDDLKRPMIKNSVNEEWKSKSTDSSNYKGQRLDHLSENHEHLSHSDLYRYDEICGIGFDIWQVESGTLFDNILITDDELEAEKHGNDTWGIIKEKEKLMKIKFDKLRGKTSPILDPDHHDEL